MTATSSSTHLWDAWASRRPRPAGIHVDSAASSRSSVECLDAVSAYAWKEAEVGAYALAEQTSATIVELRAGLADLIGVDADGVALVEGASAALAAALRVAPVERGDTVLVAPSEWGPNLQAFAAAGLECRFADVDADGVVDLDDFDRALADDPPRFVHLTPQASHRALRQPAAELLACAASHGVPVWLDVAQTAGHAAIPAGAAVVYGTSRKWLTGPRGIGFLGIAAAHRPSLRMERVPPSMRPGAGPLDALESHEAHHAGRVGLNAALREYFTVGPEVINARLTEVGQAVRMAAAELDGWRSVDPVMAEGAITALAPTAGQDVFDVRRRLLADHGIVTTAAAPARAPHDMAAPTLRLSPHVDADDAAIAAVIAALATYTA